MRAVGEKRIIVIEHLTPLLKTLDQQRVLLMHAVTEAVCEEREDTISVHERCHFIY